MVRRILLFIFFLWHLSFGGNIATIMTYGRDSLIYGAYRATESVIKLHRSIGAMD